MKAKETDMSMVKQTAILFLHLPIQETEYSPIVVQHPIFESAHHVVGTSSNPKFVNLLEDAEALDAVTKEYEKRINNADDVFAIYAIIRKPYRLTFLKYVMPYLSKHDFSVYLADAWVASENPNDDVNVPLRTSISWFKKADKKALMEPEDYQVYLSLPESFTVYRGVAVGKNPNGLSWTRSLDKAKWFANRFNNKGKKGYVQKAVITKDRVLAYFNTRDEEEIVVNTSGMEFEKI